MRSRRSFGRHLSRRSLRHEKGDIHSNARHTRYLVSCVVRDPIDDQTQIVAFIKVLWMVIKTHLFGKYPKTLDAVIRH